ncbi:MAG TPA: M48 family metalloprotease [Ktedonobacteraceae bacterium]|nr:M48 family metalloprotease [Ktedonobacteraceae bacterium]
MSNLPPDLVAFVRHAAPDLQIKTNLRRSDRQAFIYPLRYRKAAIAIFRPIVLLWYNERKRAEAKAILLHEIAHYQHGDALVVGEGSFLDIGLNWWLPIFLVFGLIPMIFLWAEQSINFVQSSTGSGNLSPTLLHELIDALTIFLPGWLLILIEEILQTISLILLPLLAFWCIELNADQAVLSTLHSGEDIIRALAQFKAPSSWQDRLFALATHPPRSLRRWIARNAGKREGIWLLLMSFPLAAFSLLLGVVPLFIVQVSQESVFHNHTDLLQSLAVDIGSTLVNLAPLWGVTAIILLVWPLVNSFWMRIFAGPEEIRRESQFVDWTNYRIYYFSACLTALLALWGCALYVLVQIKL